MWQRYDPDCGHGVGVSLDAAASAVTVTVHGTWGRRLRRETYTAMDKCLAEHPGTILVDTHDLADPGADSISTWMTTNRAAAAMQPPVRVLLHVPAGTPLFTRLHRTGAVRSMHVFASMIEAQAAATQRLTASGRFDLNLTPDDTAPARARAVVTEACEAWRLPDLLDRSRLVVSELVANAVEHAGTPITVIVSRRGTGVHTIVRDGSPDLPRLLDTVRWNRSPFGRGTGLHTVHATATGWGALPCGEGKVVWATIMPWRRR